MGNQLLKTLGCLDIVGSFGYNIGEQNATVVNKNCKRPRLGKVGLAEADQTNRLLDKWRPSDVRQLIRAYKSSIRRSGSFGESMDLSAFQHAFTELEDMPVGLAESAFRLFDKQQTGKIDFREFCTAVAICCLSTPNEQINFVFDLFDSNRNDNLSKLDVDMLLKTCLNSLRFLSQVEGKERVQSINGDKDLSADKATNLEKEGEGESWAEEAKAKLFPGSSSLVTRDNFVAWASKSLDILAILDVFRIFPTKMGQFINSSKILNNWEGLAEGDEVYVVSVTWWEEWCDYIGLTVQYESEAKRSSRYVNRSKTLACSTSENKWDQASSQVAKSDVASPNLHEALSTVTPDDDATRNLSDQSPMSTSQLESKSPAPSTHAFSESSDSHIRVESVQVDTGASTPPLMRQLSMHKYGDRPGPIDNSDLCGDVAGSIKVNLKEGHGYVLVPPKLWELLYKWYGVHGDKENQGIAQTIFKRKVIRCGSAHVLDASDADTSDKDHGIKNIDSSTLSLATQFYIPPSREVGVRVEIHPLMIRFCVMDARTGRPACKSKLLAEMSETFSAAVSITALKSQMINLLRIGIEEEESSSKKIIIPQQLHSRLWVKSKREEWRLLLPHDEGISSRENQDGHNTDSPEVGKMDAVLTAEDVDLTSGDFVMVEYTFVKEGENVIWPRDQVELRKTTFRDFEINSPVDALDRENKWYSGTVKEIVRDRDTREPVEILIKFDKFPNPKYDEWYSPDSKNLAPVYTHTLPPDDITYATTNRGGQQEQSHQSGRSTLASRAPVRGAVGLINLGNTCYMASTIQSLSHTPLLRSYFTSGKYDTELNLQNKEGTGGYLTQALADLIRRLWSNQEETAVRAIAPRPFKRALGQFRPQFQGYDQQDAHEFLITILSAVHEDTNRCDPEDNVNTETRKKNRSKTKSTKSTKIMVTSNKISTSPLRQDDPDKHKGIVVAPPDVQSIMASELALGDDETTLSKDLVGFHVPDDTLTAGVTSQKQERAREMDLEESPQRSRSRSNSTTLDLALASIDAWKKHKEKSHSIIVDLFHGQSCRSNICEECGHRISRFEPFPCLSINLRVQFAHKITVIRLPPVLIVSKKAPDESEQEYLKRQNKVNEEHEKSLKSFQRIVQYGVLTPQVGLVGDLKLSLSEKCGIKANRLSIAAGDRENLQFIGDANQLRTIGEDQMLFAFELPRYFEDIAGHPISEARNPRAKTKKPIHEAGNNQEKSLDTNDKKKLSLCLCSCRQPVHVDPLESERYDEDGEFNTNTSEEDSRLDEKDEKASGENAVRFLLDERLDACDFEGNWYPGTIVEVQLEGQSPEDGSRLQNPDGTDKNVPQTQSSINDDVLAAYSSKPNPRRTGRVMVSFDGFADKYNEWFDIGERTRVLPLHSRTVPRPQTLKAAILLHRFRIEKVSSKGVESGAPGNSVHEQNTLSMSQNYENSSTQSTPEYRYFGMPRQVWFGSQLSSREVYKVVEYHISHLVKSESMSTNKPPFQLMILKRQNDGAYGTPRLLAKTSAPPILKNTEILVAEWESSDVFNHEFDVSIEDESVAEALGQRGSEQKRNDERLTLEHCLGEYGNVETLSEDYKCDKCKAKGTTKTKVDIWRLPDILVIHMKRFVYTMYVRGKLNNLVHYPVHGLDMSPFLSAEARQGLQEMKAANELNMHVPSGDNAQSDHVYDLYATVHHVGTMNGGHYVSTCRVEGEGDNWYQFNDRNVTPIDEKQLVSQTGYILFYKRRELSSANVINLSL